MRGQRSTRIVMRKLRTGIWCSQGQGSGSVQNDGTDDGTDDTDDDDDDDDDDEDDDADKDKGKGKKDDADDPVKRANDEAKRRRIQARTEKQRADAAEARLREIENKDKPELDRIKAEHDALVKEHEAAVAEVGTWKTRALIAEHAADVGISDMSYANFLLGRDYKDLDSADDAYEDDLKEALKALVGKYPALKSEKASTDDKGKNKKEDDLPGQGGRGNGNKNGKGGNLSQQELAAKYPALRR